MKLLLDTDIGNDIDDSLALSYLLRDEARRRFASLSGIGPVRDEARRRFASLSGIGPVRDFAEVWFERSDFVTFHDPLAAVGIFHPEVCAYEDDFVRVPLAEPTAGWTVRAWPPPGEPRPHRLARTVDPGAFFRIWFGALA